MKGGNIVPSPVIPYMRRSIVLCLALLLTASAFAQHGEVDLKPFTSLPAGSLQDGIGHCDLKVTTKSEEARKFFEQGMCYYHCFHWTEAQRSFRDAVKADPGFAMGWWGLHITLMNPWNRSNTYKAEREGAIDRAVRMMSSTSPLEQDLIRAWKIWSSGANNAFNDFESAMLDICERYPKEVEPRVLMSGIYVQTNLSNGYLENGQPDKPMRTTRRLVSEAFAIDADNAAAHHYWIHACEGGPTPQEALHSADRLGEVAWNSGHMVHMPGHIYFRCGLYDKAIRSLGNARKVDEQYNKQVGTADGNWNYFHNTDFLIAAMMEGGQRSAAYDLAKTSMVSAVSYVLWRDSDFAELNKAIEAKKVKSDAMLSQFVKAMIAFDAGDLVNLEAAAKEVKNLASSAQKFDLDHLMRIETEAAIDCIKNDGANVEPMLKEVQSILAKQPYDEPPVYARPPAEGIGLALLKTTKYDLAIEAFEMALKDRPNNPYSLYGLAVATEKKGDKEGAKKLYQRVVDALKSGDKDMKIYVAAMAKITG